MNILLNKKLHDREVNYLRENLGQDYNLIIPNDFTEEEIINNIGKADVLLGDNITKEMLDKGNIKLIQIPFAGVERLDCELLSKYNIPVCNSHSNSLPVAEYAVALLLSIAKKLPYHDKLLREGNWNNIVQEDTYEGLSTYSSYVYNKTIGFIGYGSIGRKVAKLLKGFDPKLMAIVNDKNKSYEELDFIGDKNDLDYVLENADYLVVASPLTPETRGMLNKDNLVKMKKTSYIINISRGRIIDESSLYYVLENNLIRGAAIDTWYNYPKNEVDPTFPSRKFDFHKLNNIIITPHRADLIYGEIPYLDHAIQNIKALKEGKELINRVDLSKGY